MYFFSLVCFNKLLIIYLPARSLRTLSAKNGKNLMMSIWHVLDTANSAQGDAGRLLLSDFTKAKSRFPEKDVSGIIS